MPKESFASLVQGFPPNAFLVGFASVNWRETWKYGERAFRYCQHDVGHAIGSARIAAQTLGWRMLLLDGLADDTVAALLGLDRFEDFEGAEQSTLIASPLSGAPIKVPVLALERDSSVRVPSFGCCSRFNATHLARQGQPAESRRPCAVGDPRSDGSRIVEVEH